MIGLIKHLRKAKGISQKDLADKIHLTKSAYSRLESGHTKMTIDRFHELCKALDVSPLDIYEATQKDWPFIEMKFHCEMLDQAYDNLSETMLTAIPWEELTPEHHQLLRRKGYDTRIKYEDTPRNGRIYDFGPMDLFQYMLNTLGMAIVFKIRIIRTGRWFEMWTRYQRCQSVDKTIAGIEMMYLDKSKVGIEIDEDHYFTVYHGYLVMPDKTEVGFQFAERDFDENTYETFEDQITKKTGAVEALICAGSLNGYDVNSMIVR